MKLHGFLEKAKEVLSKEEAKIFHSEILKFIKENQVPFKTEKVETEVLTFKLICDINAYFNKHLSQIIEKSSLASKLYPVFAANQHPHIE